LWVVVVQVVVETVVVVVVLAAWFSHHSRWVVLHWLSLVTVELKWRTEY
jgi:hypothetical protein